MEFSKLNLNNQILEAIKEKGYKKPSKIQELAIPQVLTGNDLMATAQTGTGKTAAFVLPILQNLIKGEAVKPNQARVLILTPTRELAAQISENISFYGKNLSLKSFVIFGGVKINPQMQKLRGGVDILVATPGRLLDLHSQNAIKFDSLEILVLDEADRMLDMGFIKDIKRILRFLPKKRQTLMFSATFSEEIRKLASQFLQKPEVIATAQENTTIDLVSQIIHPVDKAKKTALLIHLIQEKGWFQILVFSRTKHGANRIVKFLDKEKIKAVAIHGNKSQGARTRALSDFKNNKVSVLVATDIAARGIDIKELQVVVNFDLPSVPEDYVHRIGRTGRASATGLAVSLVSADEAKQLFDIERLIQQKIKQQQVDGFEPDHNLPEGRLLPPKNKKAKKPNKPRNKPRYGKNGADKKDNKKQSFWQKRAKKSFS